MGEFASGRTSEFRMGEVSSSAPEFVCRRVHDRVHESRPLVLEICVTMGPRVAQECNFAVWGWMERAKLSKRVLVVTHFAARGIPPLCEAARRVELGLRRLRTDAGFRAVRRPP